MRHTKLRALALTTIAALSIGAGTASAMDSEDPFEDLVCSAEDYTCHNGGGYGGAWGSGGGWGTGGGGGGGGGGTGGSGSGVPDHITNPPGPLEPPRDPNWRYRGADVAECYLITTPFPCRRETWQTGPNHYVEYCYWTDYTPVKHKIPCGKP